MAKDHLLLSWLSRSELADAEAKVDLRIALAGLGIEQPGEIERHGELNRAADAEADRRPPTAVRRASCVRMSESNAAGV